MVSSAVTVYPHTLYTFGIGIVCKCFVCLFCVSVLLSHTVLAELYQEKLVAEDEVTRMEGRGGDLLYQLIPIQFSKPPEVVTKTADILDTIGFNNEAIQLRGW